MKGGAEAGSRPQEGRARRRVAALAAAAGFQAVTSRRMCSGVDRLGRKGARTPSVCRSLASPLPGALPGLGLGNPVSRGSRGPVGKRSTTVGTRLPPHAPGGWFCHQKPSSSSSPHPRWEKTPDLCWRRAAPGPFLQSPPNFPPSDLRLWAELCPPGGVVSHESAGTRRLWRGEKPSAWAPIRWDWGRRERGGLGTGGQHVRTPPARSEPGAGAPEWPPLPLRLPELGQARPGVSATGLWSFVWQPQDSDTPFPLCVGPCHAQRLPAGVKPGFVRSLSPGPWKQHRLEL